MVLKNISRFLCDLFCHFKVIKSFLKEPDSDEAIEVFDNARTVFLSPFVEAAEAFWVKNCSLDVLDPFRRGRQGGSQPLCCEEWDEY